jgi:hypothetical protein
MARIIDNKLLFVHVPKTGGTFIRELISKAGIKNWETGLFEEHDHKGITDLDEFRSLPSFGLIRKPYEWTISRWKWGMYTEFGLKVKGGTKAKSHWMADVWSEDINEFLFNTIHKRAGIAEETMFNMLGIGTDKEVTYVIKNEEMEIPLIDIFQNHLHIDIKPYYNSIKNTKELKLNKEIKYPFLKEEIEKQNPNLMKYYHQPLWGLL